MTLLERESALDTLDRALAATTAGHGRTVVVSGEAGIGKTALLRVFAEHVAARPGRPARLLWGGCDPLFTPRPLGPLHDVSLQSSGPLRAALRENAARETVFAEALAELSRAATVLVLEDLHWADEATLDLLRFIGRRVERLPLLLIATFRSDELPARRRLFAVLGELPVDLTSRITLSPLSKSAVERLAAERACTRRDLHALTGGNPLLVSELLAAGGDSLPETVRDAALARVARLSDPARAAVETLCVLPAGMRESWREALGVPSDALDECLSSGIVRADRTTIAFRHELTRQSIESTLPEPRRQRLHRAALGSLASIPDGTVPLSVLVHHALHGNDSAAVLAHAPRAAEQAVLAGANREAAALYAIALEHARAMSPAARAALLEAAARVQLIAGTPGVEQHAMEALELFRAAADRLGEGRMLLWLARWGWFSSDRERRDSALANATRILENQSESAELATAYNYRASMHMVQEEYPEAIDWATRGLALAERVGNTEAAIYALNTMGSSLLGAGRTEEGVAALERSLELALGRPGMAEDVARACTNLWVSLAECGEIARGARYLEQGLDFSVKRDLDGYVATLLAERVGLRARRGELTGALEDAAGLRGSLGWARLPLRSGSGPARRRPGRGPRVPRAPRIDGRRSRRRQGAAPPSRNGGEDPTPRPPCVHPLASCRPHTPRGAGARTAVRRSHQRGDRQDPRALGKDGGAPRIRHPGEAGRGDTDGGRFDRPSLRRQVAAPGRARSLYRKPRGSAPKFGGFPRFRRADNCLESLAFRGAAPPRDDHRDTVELLRFSVVDLPGLAMVFWLAFALALAAVIGCAAVFGLRRSASRYGPGAGAHGHRLWANRCSPANPAGALTVTHEVAPRISTLGDLRRTSANDPGRAVA